MSGLTFTGGLVAPRLAFAVSVTVIVWPGSVGIVGVMSVTENPWTPPSAALNV